MAIKKLNTITSNTFYVGQGFMIDIIRDTDPMYGQCKNEAYIYHKEYGVKNLMFGDDSSTPGYFKSLVFSNMNDYMDIYRKDYM